MAKPRVKIPKKIAAGEAFEIKTLISHKMESGLRKNADTGEIIPRDIIHEFQCMVDGKAVFRTKLHPAISANPYLSFYLTLNQDAEIEFIWTDDRGEQTTLKKSVKVGA